MQLLGTPFGRDIGGETVWCFTMEDLRDGGDVPMWDGSQTPLEDFAEEVELCVLGSKLEFRRTCGPKTRASPCTWRATERTLAMGLCDSRKFPKHLLTYLFRCHRAWYESMPNYILRESLLRERVIKAMKVVDVQLEDVLHPVTRTFLLMENAVMLAQSRISIMNLCSNLYTYDAVPRALRADGHGPNGPERNVQTCWTSLIDKRKKATTQPAEHTAIGWAMTIWKKMKTSSTAS